jgi:hypothetical protein
MLINCESICPWLYSHISRPASKRQNPSDLTYYHTNEGPLKKSCKYQSLTASSLNPDSRFGQVKEAEQLGSIFAFAYCKENVADARRMGRKLSVEIKGCEKWSLVFVGPEHLKDPEWREFTEWPVFQANIAFGCVDEAHLIYEWGLNFRLASASVATSRNFAAEKAARAALVCQNVKCKKTGHTIENCFAPGGGLEHAPRLAWYLDRRGAKDSAAVTTETAAKPPAETANLASGLSDHFRDFSMAVINDVESSSSMPTPEDYACILAHLSTLLDSGCTSHLITDQTLFHTYDTAGAMSRPRIMVNCSLSLAVTVSPLSPVTG